MDPHLQDTVLDTIFNHAKLCANDVKLLTLAEIIYIVSIIESTFYIRAALYYNLMLIVILGKMMERDLIMALCLLEGLWKVLIHILRHRLAKDSKL